MPASGPKDPNRTDTKDIAGTTKDIRKDDISSVLDRHIVQTNPFGHNTSGENSYKRAERIAAATHLITAHISQEEPVRQLIRREGAILLTHILDLRNEMRVTRSEKIRRAQASIRKLISYVRLLGASGFVSAQNAQVLIGALDELGVLLTTAQRSTLAEDVVIGREDLIPRIQEASHQARPSDRGSLSHEEIHRKRGSQGNQGAREIIKDSKRTTLLSGRSDRVLDMLRTGNQLGIKDISSNLPEYSEKMIQRELAVLVSDGKVRKVGSKRWSKYEIVQ